MFLQVYKLGRTNKLFQFTKRVNEELLLLTNNPTGEIQVKL